MTPMTRRELRTMRREWRKVVRKAGALTRSYYPKLACQQLEFADVIERRMRSLDSELKESR